MASVEVLGGLGSLEKYAHNPEFGQHLVWRKLERTLKGQESQACVLLAMTVLGGKNL